MDSWHPNLYIQPTWSIPSQATLPYFCDILYHTTKIPSVSKQSNHQRSWPRNHRLFSVDLFLNLATWPQGTLSDPPLLCWTPCSFDMHFYPFSDFLYLYHHVYVPPLSLRSFTDKIRDCFFFSFLSRSVSAHLHDPVIVQATLTTTPLLRWTSHYGALREAFIVFFPRTFLRKVYRSAFIGWFFIFCCCFRFLLLLIRE